MLNFPTASRSNYDVKPDDYSDDYSNSSGTEIESSENLAYYLLLVAHEYFQENQIEKSISAFKKIMELNSKLAPNDGYIFCTEYQKLIASQYSDIMFAIATVDMRFRFT